MRSTKSGEEVLRAVDGNAPSSFSLQMTRLHDCQIVAHQLQVHWLLSEPMLPFNCLLAHNGPHMLLLLLLLLHKSIAISDFHPLTSAHICHLRRHRSVCLHPRKLHFPESKKETIEFNALDSLRVAGKSKRLIAIKRCVFALVRAHSC